MAIIFTRQFSLGQRGDTLIEVTLALAILSFVLAGAFAITVTTFRMGQNARERTSISQVAQNQMEALRSYRDNHTWTEFRNGVGGHPGIDTVVGGGCAFTSPCFYMENVTIGSNKEWVPRAGRVADPTVPNSIIEISTTTPTANRPCAYDFVLNYRFIPGGGAVASRNHISTRLANLKFDPSGGAVCP